MQIIADSPSNRIEEHERMLRRLLAEKSQELQSQKSFHRLIARIKIAWWAWRKSARDSRKLYHKDSPYSRY
jgi:hypothetical protein